jgi:hypothetical protein
MPPATALLPAAWAQRDIRARGFPPIATREPSGSDGLPEPLIAVGMRRKRLFDSTLGRGDRQQAGGAASPRPPRFATLASTSSS